MSARKIIFFVFLYNSSLVRTCDNDIIIIYNILRLTAKTLALCGGACGDVDGDVRYGAYVVARARVTRDRRGRTDGRTHALERYGMRLFWPYRLRWRWRCRRRWRRPGSVGHGRWWVRARALVRYEKRESTSGGGYLRCGVAVEKIRSPQNAARCVFFFS